MLSDDDDDDDDNDDDKSTDIKIFTEQIPLVIEALREHRQLQIRKKIIEMICRNTFPMTNTANLLFLDVVKWFSHDNSVCMRYNKILGNRIQIVSWEVSPFHGWFKE
jgi:hypothetical protein